MLGRCATVAVAVAMTLGAGAQAAGAASSQAPAAKLGVHSASGVTFVVDGHRRSLYLFAKDKAGRSACSGACAEVWAPLLTSGRPSAGAGVRGTLAGTIKRKDGTRQATYAGHPLYRFAGDTSPGTTKGEGVNGFGAHWYLVAPSGHAIMSMTSASPTPSKTTPSRAPGYGY